MSGDGNKANTRSTSTQPMIRLHVSRLSPADVRKYKPSSDICAVCGRDALGLPLIIFLVAHVGGRARTIYVGAEEPANASAFSECHLGKAGEVLPELVAKTS